jgi:hypothetical protein
VTESQGKIKVKIKWSFKFLFDKSERDILAVNGTYTYSEIKTNEK